MATPKGRAARIVACPACGAPWGSPCVDTSGKPCRTHRERHHAAEEARKAERAPDGENDAPRPPQAPKAAPSRPIEAKPGKAAEAVPVEVTKPIPEVEPIPAVLGTAIPRPTILGELAEYATPDSIDGLDGRLVGVVGDLWRMQHTHPLRALARGDAAVIAYQDGIGSWLLGEHGHFERLRTMGPHPFGLAALVMPATGEPYLVLRWAYRHEDHPVLGECWIVRQDPRRMDWTTHRRGNASAAAMRWAVEV